MRILLAMVVYIVVLGTMILGGYIGAVRLAGSAASILKPSAPAADSGTDAVVVTIDQPPPAKSTAGKSVKGHTKAEVADRLKHGKAGQPRSSARRHVSTSGLR